MSEFDDILAGTGLAERLDDDAFWIQHDAEVQKQREAEAAGARRAELEVRIRQLRDYGVPRRIARAVLADDFDAAAPAVCQLASALDGGPLAVLAGDVGVGKTAAAVAWLLHRGGARPVFIRATEAEAQGRYDRELRERWRRATSLVLDDLGTEYADARGNWLVTLDEIVDLYHADERPLAITTNLTSQAFKERYGARITSRLRGDGGWRVVRGNDRRSA